MDSMNIRNFANYESKKDDLIKMIKKHQILDSNTLAIYKFRNECRRSGTWDHVKRNIDLWQYIFFKTIELKSNDLIELFSYNQSLQGTNDKESERNTVFFFNRFIRNCESNYN